jgi:hypothetical protein
MLGDLKKADDSKWVAHLSLIHGCPIALGATAQPMVVWQGATLLSEAGAGGPPQVGVRHRPGASISEAAWLPVERDPSVTTEAAELWSPAGSSTPSCSAKG